MKAKKDETDWKRLQKMSDKEIDCLEIPDMSNFDWTHADIVIPGAKTRMTMRIDTDVYEFFRHQGPRYQSRINAVLRTYMEHLQTPVSFRGARSPGAGLFNKRLDRKPHRH